MIHKIIFMLLLLASLLSMLVGCIYYIPAPDGETQGTESTDTTDTTDTSETADESDSESASEDDSDTETAPSRDDGYTSYH